MCIDYRMVNSLTKLMIYPMPVIDELLENLEGILWFCSLDMASGFWVVNMTKRASLISAFITPFGLFQWERMPFGLKNAPQIYQRLLDNALYGMVKRRDDGAEDGDGVAEVEDVFEAGVPASPEESSVIGRRSYIDDILIGDATWDGLCE